MGPVVLDHAISPQDRQGELPAQSVVRCPGISLHRLQPFDHSLQPFHECHPEPSSLNTSSMTFAARWRDSAAMPPYRSTVVATFACPSVAMTMRRSPPEPSSMSAAAV